MDVPPATTLVFEFPALAASLQSRADDQRAIPAASAYLPANHRWDRRYPLLCFLGGGAGGHGRDPGAARRIAGDRGTICITLPLFKRRIARLRPNGANRWSRLYVRHSDAKAIWEAYAVMLDRIFTTLPTIDPDRCTIGGFSNGAHTTAVLLGRPKAEIRDRFSRFLFVEGGRDLRPRSPLGGCPTLMLRGEQMPPWLDDARDAALAAGADLTYELIPRTGHAMPRKTRLRIRRWLKGLDR